MGLNKMTNTPAASITASIAAVIAATGVLVAGQRQPPPPQAPQVSQSLRDRVLREGRGRVIVELGVAGVPEGDLPDVATILQQRQAIADLGARALTRVPASARRVVHRFQTVPLVALDVDANGLAALENASPEVVRIVEDAILRPVLAESVPLVQGDQAWAVGYDGSGSTIAILDTGIDAGHPFLAGKVIEEACYSTTTKGTSQTVCPNGHDVQIGPGAGAPCALTDCFHGTHVAGIAAGSGASGGVPFSGVAKGANLMAVQVFTKITNPVTCGGFGPCLGAFTSDIIAGLERVYAVAALRNVASVNMSLGGATFAAPCDSDPTKPMIDNLRSIGVAVVVAAGNNGSTSQLTTPGCVSSAVSVGSTTKTDEVSYFSNVAPFLSLFAPGDSITSSVPGGGYAAFSGTSMATPHVAGTWAILKQAMPTGTVSALLTALRNTGLPIADTRLTGTVTVPRERIFQALASLVPITNPSPNISTLAPARGRAGTGFILTVTGSGFDAFSLVRWNGTNMPTTVANTTTLMASIPGSALPAVGTAQVTVFTPTPGGGTASALTFTIDPPPTLTVSAPVVAPGGSEAVTLANGFGGASDWLALAATGTSDMSYLQWVYVGSGATDRTWTVTMPTTGGTYEFRLFLNNTFTRAATSAPVTVDPSFSPAPTLASLSPGTAPVGGAPFALTVNGGGFVSSSVVRWNGANRPTTFVSGTQLQAAIGASDIAALGSAQVSVFTPGPGGGTSSALTFSVTPPPTLSISSSSVQGGGSETVTLANGLGGGGDWLALAATATPNTGYVQYVYVGSGVTTRTWTVTMPMTPGTYEFRLFPNNGYVRAATSPTITVVPGPNPVPTMGSLSPSTMPVGAAAFTLIVNGDGFVSSSLVRWNGVSKPTTFVGATQLQAAIGAGELTTIGTSQVTVFSPAPGGGISLPAVFTIAPAAPPPPPASLTISAATVSGGASETVTLTNGPGNAWDWLALAPASAPDTAYLQWVYVGSGATTTTWTVAMPSMPGDYEFRLFLNNGFVRGATSPSVTVLAGPNPTPTVTLLAPSGAPVGAAVTMAVNGSGFVPSSIVRWNGLDRPTTFVSGTALQATIPATDLVTAATAEISVFSPAPGGGVSAGVPFTIGRSPSLTVSSMSARAGGSVTATLTNGFGATYDWLALALTSASNTSYVQWVFVGSGVTSTTWTVTMPSTPGTYEFRLFMNDGYTRAATSPSITVSP
ncbi:MAG TPA: S8 family serine peptidase [Vicinamibacterales bacterium]|nr:S8 family serine peptidase [Vicinamibacterales bacterium]